MATRDVRNIAEQLTCALCLDCYTNPRTLPCDHSFCCECIKEYITSTRALHGISTSFTCPTCRQTIHLKNSKNVDESIKEFQLNVFLEDMVSKLKFYESDAPSVNTPVKDDGGQSELRKEYNSIHKMLDDKITELEQMMTIDYKANLDLEIKTVTLRDIEKFERNLENFRQRTLHKTQSLKQQLQIGSCYSYEHYDSQIRRRINQTQRLREQLRSLENNMSELRKFRDKQKLQITQIENITEFPRTILEVDKDLTSLFARSDEIVKFGGEMFFGRSLCSIQ